MNASQLVVRVAVKTELSTNNEEVDFAGRPGRRSPLATASGTDYGAENRQNPLLWSLETAFGFLKFGIYAVKSDERAN
jgi:hypothetical protein